MNFIARLRNLLPHSAAARARASYDKAALNANATWVHLDERGALHAHTRARLLSSLAIAETQMGDGYAAGYGLGYASTDSIVQVHVDTTELLHLLASTSAADCEPWSRVKARRAWEEAFGTVLDDLAKSATHAPVYAEILTRLYFAVAEHVGPGAADTVERLHGSILSAVDHRLAGTTAG